MPKSQELLPDIASAAAYALSTMPSIIPDAPSAQTIGLIVVSATRSAHNLQPSIELARNTGIELVILTSHGLDADAVTSTIRQAGAKGRAIAVPDDYVMPLTTDFATHKHKRTISRKSNLSAKRNLGLAIGYLTKRHVFFLDDDIRGITSEKLALVGSGLRDHAIAGFFIDYFPDSAVTRHAYRLAGGNQAPDLTGNSLAVNVDRAFTFFPNVYNEDLLFVYDALATRDAVALSWAKQLEYDPFTDTKRAVSEEFGCVLAVEGLLSLLAAGQTYQQADGDYWDEVLARRHQFIDDVIQGLKAKRGLDARIEPALKAVTAARHELATYTADDFTSYVSSWRADIALWQNRLQALPRNLTLEETLDCLASYIIPA